MPLTNVENENVLTIIFMGCVNLNGTSFTQKALIATPCILYDLYNLNRKNILLIRNNSNLSALTVELPS